MGSYVVQEGKRHECKHKMANRALWKVIRAMQRMKYVRFAVLSAVLCAGMGPSGAATPEHLELERPGFTLRIDRATGKGNIMLGRLSTVQAQIDWHHKKWQWQQEHVQIDSFAVTKNAGTEVVAIGGKFVGAPLTETLVVGSDFVEVTYEVVPRDPEIEKGLWLFPCSWWQHVDRVVCAAPVRYRIGLADGRVVDGTMTAKIKGIPVRRRAAVFHFLHRGMYMGKGVGSVGHYTMHYADGTQATIPLIEGDNIRDWWSVSKGDLKNARVAWAGTNLVPQSLIGWYRFAWNNPHPEKMVSTVDTTSNGKALLGLIAITGQE